MHHELTIILVKLLFVSISIKVLFNGSNVFIEDMENLLRECLKIWHYVKDPHSFESRPWLLHTHLDAFYFVKCSLDLLDTFYFFAQICLVLS